jgi:hypothetical protein
MNLTPEQKQDLRHEILRALGIRAPAALAPRQISKAVKRELDFLFEEADTEAALEYLRGIGLVQFTHDDLGSTKYWQATTAGIQHFERA